VSTAQEHRPPCWPKWPLSNSAWADRL
jgi:hypothetical protein